MVVHGKRFYAFAYGPWRTLRIRAKKTYAGNGKAQCQEKIWLLFATLQGRFMQLFPFREEREGCGKKTPL